MGNFLFSDFPITYTMSDTNKPHTIIHKNEYEKLSSQKKAKWVQRIAPPETSYMFTTFGGPEEARMLREGERKLKLAGLSFSILDHKYKDVEDTFVELFDLDHVVIWAARHTINFFYGGRFRVGDKIYPRMVEMNPTNVEYFQKVGSLTEELPEVLELETQLVSIKGEFLFKIRYVGI